jgi:hypothetical protein
MASKKAATKTAGKAVKKKATTKRAGSKKSADRERIKKLVRNAMKGLETRLGGEDKPSIGDYLKVMQLQKEIEEDGPKEIKVTWVEPETPTSESEG